MSGLIAAGLVIVLSPIAALPLRLLVWGRSESLNDATSALSKAREATAVS
jgi:hypothetical protein